MPTLQLKPSPIQLLSQDVLGVRLDATVDQDEFGGSQLSVERETHPIKDQPDCWALKLRIKFDAADSTHPPEYLGEIELIGYYRVHKHYKQDPEKLIRITGASMLYGVAREMISSITARSANGMLTLPSVSFFEESPKKKAAKKATKKKTAKI